jgi:hypothetical protein
VWCTSRALNRRTSGPLHTRRLHFDLSFIRCVHFLNLRFPCPALSPPPLDVNLLYDPLPKATSLVYNYRGPPSFSADKVISLQASQSRILCTLPVIPRVFASLAAEISSRP